MEAALACLACDICCLPYDQCDRIPRVLPCGHTFCSQDLELIVDRAALQCPACHVWHALTRAGVNGVAQNFKLLEILDVQKHANDQRKSSSLMSSLSSFSSSSSSSSSSVLSLPASPSTSSPNKSVDTPSPPAPQRRALGIACLSAVSIEDFKRQGPARQHPGLQTQPLAAAVETPSAAQSAASRSHSADAADIDGVAAPKALSLKIIAARDLMARDVNGFSDPSCVITYGGKVQKTQTKKKTLNPLWDYEVMLKFAGYGTNIEICCRDRDFFGLRYQSLGKCTIAMDVLEATGWSFNGWLPLDDATSGHIYIEIQPLS